MLDDRPELAAAVDAMLAGAALLGVERVEMGGQLLASQHSIADSAPITSHLRG